MTEDKYAWLRDKDNPEVLTYLKKQNDRTEEYLADTQELQDDLYKEMVARIKETDTSAPHQEGDYLYYSHTFAGKQYKQYCRKKGSLEAPEEILLDLNALAEDHDYLDLGVFEVSPDGTTLAYSLDTNGSEEYTLYFKDLATGDVTTTPITNIVSLAWCLDNKSYYYTVRDDAWRPYQLYRHIPGQEDTLVYEEKDNQFTIDVMLTKSEKYIMLTCNAGNANEYRFALADDPHAEFKIMESRREDHEYYADHHDSGFFILTNQKDGKKQINFRLVKAPLDNPSESHWEEVVPHDEDITLEDLDVFKNYLVVTKRVQGLKELHVHNFASQQTQVVPQPELVYSVETGNNLVYDTKLLRYYYTSLTSPTTVLDYNMASGEKTTIKVQEVLGGYNSDDYQSERVWATAPDGVKVPISLVYKKSLDRNMPQPLYMTGYGAYGVDYDVYFSSARLSLMDRGVIFAIAHIRGGGDLGEKWREAGKMLKKKNTFTDFIACAEHLIKKNYTTSDTLAVEGSSAGGLLMGAITNLRPDLFKSVIANVPFVDVLNTMMDDTLPLTTGEYVEWGNPNEPKYHDFIKSYCPYQNVSAQAYPTVLVRASLNDPRVGYWEGAKWAAKLQEHTTSDNPILLLTNLGAGHAGSSGRYDKLVEIALDFAFVLKTIR